MKLKVMDEATNAELFMLFLSVINILIPAAAQYSLSKVGNSFDYNPIELAKFMNNFVYFRTYFIPLVVVVSLGFVFYKRGKSALFNSAIVFNLIALAYSQYLYIPSISIKFVN